MRKVKWTARGPNKLLGSDIVKLSDHPLLGVVLMQTDRWDSDVAINQAAAEELFEALGQFLKRAKARPE